MPLLKPEVIKTIENKSGLPVLALNEVDNIPLATTGVSFHFPQKMKLNAANTYASNKNLTTHYRS